MGADKDKKDKFHIVQVSNICISASKDQIYSMMQYIGRINDYKIYPSDHNITSQTSQKVAFVKYEDERCVEAAQHLTNTVLIESAIVCVPWLQQVIPTEDQFLASGGPTAAGQRSLPPHISNKTQTDAEGNPIMVTEDPTLAQLGLPAYPSLPGDTDYAKMEEIRRTIYIGNLPKGVEPQTVLDFFNSYIGEVMYLRMATGPESLPCAYAYLEFSQQPSVPIALQNSGIDFGGRPLKIQHSRVPIIKPQQKTNEQAMEEVEEAIRLDKDKEKVAGETTNSPRRRRSVSRSRSPRRRRSPSPRVRRRSRSRSRRRSRSRVRRSRSRDRKRSRSRERRRRTRSRDRKRSSSRDRKKDRDRKERKRSRSRSRDRDRKKDRRDRSSDRKRDRKDKDKDKDRKSKTNPDDEEKLREKLLEKAAARSAGSKEDVSESDEKLPSKIRNERKRKDSDSD